MCRRKKGALESEDGEEDEELPEAKRGRKDTLLQRAWSGEISEGALLQTMALQDELASVLHRCSSS